MKDKKILSAELRLKLFEAVLRFMDRCEIGSVEIQRSFEAALEGHRSRRTADEGSDVNDTLYINKQNLPAQLLRIWHRDSKFLDQDAKPRPLFLVRGRNSLRSMVASIDPRIDADATLRSMRKVGLIRRAASGKYLPTSEMAIVDQLHPQLVHHVTRLVTRLIGTVGRNSDPTGKSLSLVDRHAYTADLDPAERKAFADFTRSHGTAYLEAIDDWLAQRRVKSGSSSKSRKAASKGVAAGVYLFAYLGDKEGMAALRGTAKRTSSSRAKGGSARKTSRSRKTRSARAVRA